MSYKTNTAYYLVLLSVSDTTFWPFLDRQQAREQGEEEQHAEAGEEHGEKRQRTVIGFTPFEFRKDGRDGQAHRYQQGC